MLLTMFHIDQIDGGTQKPEIILCYNSAKSGVHNLDHLLTMYTSTIRWKINHWPVALFRNIVDVGAVAAFVFVTGSLDK